MNFPEQSLPAIEVQRNLGRGLLESAYEEFLSYELANSGLTIRRQEPIPVVYKEVKVECGYRIDILVEKSDRCRIEVGGFIASCS